MLCEMLAFAGYDFVILDLEHLLRSEEDIMHCVRACEAAGISPWLRMAQVDEKLIGRALDAGIEAIVLSRTESAVQVQRAIEAAFFPPLGKRGMTGGRITGFGRLPLPEYIDLANRQTPIIPMIESRAGVDALAPASLFAPTLAPSNRTRYGAPAACAVFWPVKTVACCITHSKPACILSNSNNEST